MSRSETMLTEGIFEDESALEAEGIRSGPWSLRKILNRIFPDARERPTIDAQASLGELTLRELEEKLKAATE